MRHKIKGRKLNRTSSHRKALLINLSVALLKHEIIKTTLPKAKELRPFVEKLITAAKTDNLSNRRKVLSVIKDKEIVTKLFSDISERTKDRKGGYTRIMHYGFRVGDKAPMAVIELVDRKEESNDKDSGKKTSKKAAAKPKKDSKVATTNKDDSKKATETKVAKKKSSEPKSDKK